MLSPPSLSPLPSRAATPARSKFGDHGAGRAHRAVERVADALIACFAAFVPLAVAGFVRGEYDAWGDCSAEWPAWALPIFLALNTAISVAQSVIFLRPLFEGRRARAPGGGGAKAEPQTKMGAGGRHNAGAVDRGAQHLRLPGDGDRRARLARVRRAERGARGLARSLSPFAAVGARARRARSSRARARRAQVFRGLSAGDFTMFDLVVNLRMLRWVPVVALCQSLLGCDDCLPPPSYDPLRARPASRQRAPPAVPAARERVAARRRRRRPRRAPRVRACASGPSPRLRRSTAARRGRQRRAARGRPPRRRPRGGGRAAARRAGAGRAARARREPSARAPRTRVPPPGGGRGGPGRPARGGPDGRPDTSPTGG